MRPKSKFRAGDHIRIVSVSNCSYGSNDEMLECLNSEGTVVSSEWDAVRNIYAYRLDIDYRRFLWCDNCLELAQTADIEESDASLDILLGVV